MNIRNIQGISVGYDFRTLLLPTIKTPSKVYSMHYAFFDIMGKGVLSGSNDLMPDGIGAFVSFLAKKRTGNLTENNFYLNHYRIMEINTNKNELISTGARIKLIVPIGIL